MGRTLVGREGRRLAAAVAGVELGAVDARAGVVALARRVEPRVVRAATVPQHPVLQPRRERRHARDRSVLRAGAPRGRWVMVGPGWRSGGSCTMLNVALRSPRCRSRYRAQCELLELRADEVAKETAGNQSQTVAGVAVGACMLHAFARKALPSALLA